MRGDGCSVTGSGSGEVTAVLVRAKNLYYFSSEVDLQLRSYEARFLVMGTRLPRARSVTDEKRQT